MASSFLNLDIKAQADSAVGAVRKILAPMRAFGLKVEVGGDKGKDDTIFVPFVSAVSAAERFNTSTNNFKTSNGGLSQGRPVTLGDPFKSTFDIPLAKLPQVMRSGTLQQLWDAHAEAVVRAALGEIYTKIQLMNFGTGIDVGASSAFDRDVMIDVRREFRDATGSNGYWAALNMSFYGALIKDLSQVDTVGFNDTLMQGVVPGIAGFREIIETNDLSNGGENREGFVTDGTGLLLANWVPAPYMTEKNMFEVAIDPFTGIALGFSVVQDDATETAFFSVRTCLDVGLGRPEGLKLLTSAASTVATPTFDPAAGAYSAPVAIATATPDATIHYTIDGSTPTTASPVYSAPIALSVTTTIKALGVKNGYTNSAVASGTFTVS